MECPALVRASNLRGTNLDDVVARETGKVGFVYTLHELIPKDILSNANEESAT